MSRTYLNTTPIDDEWTVLDLLARNWGDRTRRTISLWPHAPPHVDIEHLHDFGDCPHDRVLITEAVAASLKVAGYVIGKPEWGYRQERELLLTEAGERILWAIPAKKDAPYGFDSLRWIRACAER